MTVHFPGGWANNLMTNNVAELGVSKPISGRPANILPAQSTRRLQDVCLSIAFFKPFDVYDEEYATALAESGGDEEYALFSTEYRSKFRRACHWSDVRVVTANVGQALQKSMRGIETAKSRHALWHFRRCGMVE